MCYRRRQVGKEPHPHIGGAGLPCRSGRGGCRQAERVYGAVSRNKGICGHGRSHCLRLRRIYGCASCGTSLSGRQETAGKRAERYAGKADDAHRRAVCRTGGTGATHGSAPDGGACLAVSSGVP